MRPGNVNVLSQVHAHLVSEEEDTCEEEDTYTRATLTFSAKSTRT
jgi:hypothetical protein